MMRFAVGAATIDVIVDIDDFRLPLVARLLSPPRPIRRILNGLQGLRFAAAQLLEPARSLSLGGSPIAAIGVHQHA